MRKVEFQISGAEIADFARRAQAQNGRGMVIVSQKVLDLKDSPKFAFLEQKYWEMVRDQYAFIDYFLQPKHSLYDVSTARMFRAYNLETECFVVYGNDVGLPAEDMPHAPVEFMVVRLADLEAQEAPISVSFAD